MTTTTWITTLHAAASDNSSVLALVAVAAALLCAAGLLPVVKRSIILTAPTKLDSKFVVSTAKSGTHSEPLATLVHKHCPSLARGFRPRVLFASGHLQTVLASGFNDASVPRADYVREMVSFADGGSAAVDWVVPPHHATSIDARTSLPSVIDPTRDKAIAVVLHGLTGGSQEHYVQAIVAELVEHGFKTVVFNSRGCAGTSITSPALYSGGYTGDLDHLLRTVVCKRFPNTKVVAVGCSLGANILTKYVGEQGHRCVLSAMVSLANPFDLLVSGKVMHSKFLGRHIYSRAMTKALVRLFRRNMEQLNGLSAIDRNAIISSKYIHDFDNRCTAKMFRYRSADEYYRHASSAKHIPDIRVPALFINSLDDPIVDELAIPYDDIQSNPFTVLATTKYGGHLGWYTNGRNGLSRSRRWFPAPTAEFLALAIDLTPTNVQCSFSRIETGLPIASDCPLVKSALLPD